MQCKTHFATQPLRVWQTLVPLVDPSAPRTVGIDGTRTEVFGDVVPLSSLDDMVRTKVARGCAGLTAES